MSAHPYIVAVVAAVASGVVAATAPAYCKYCGHKATSVAVLTSGWCPRHPDGSGKGHHALYEGGEKAQYVCKHCGHKAHSLQLLTSGWCPRHPNGSGKGCHAPAL